MSRETKEVPKEVRAFVYERDGHCCRVCGAWVEQPGLHHIDYRSQGGLHVPENLVTIGWLPGHDCHLPIVHAHKRIWQPILKVVAVSDGVTGNSLLRAYREKWGLTE